MRLVEYTPDHFDLLHAAASRMASRNLRHRAFVNHYYASSPWCRLHLLVSREDNVVGALGLERMPFRFGSQHVTIGFGTNYYSLEPGAGGFLFMHWLKNCDVGMSFGGSPDAHHVIRSQRWPYFDGIGVYLLNKPYEVYAGDPAWKRTAKRLARYGARRRIASYSRNIPPQVAKRISVREESAFAADLLPRTSPFEFRFTPGVDYLAWRYNSRLPFVRYRLFRILDGGKTRGYVVLNESPERILVSQCDGEDPEALAWGVVMSVLKAGETDESPRTVKLTCSNPAMQQVYRSVGFKAESEHPFALGSLRRGVAPPADSPTSNWLVNYDWGDNGLLDLSDSTDLPETAPVTPRSVSSESRI